MKIVNLEMPRSVNEFGIFNLENMPSVYYRFELINGNPVLQEDLFADNQPEEKKYKEMTIEMFQNIQLALVAHIHGLGSNDQDQGSQ